MAGDYKYTPGDSNVRFVKLIREDLTITNTLPEKYNIVIIEVIYFIFSEYRID